MIEIGDKIYRIDTRMYDLEIEIYIVKNITKDYYVFEMGWKYCYEIIKGDISLFVSQDELYDYEDNDILELQIYYVDEEGFKHFKEEYNKWVTNEINTLKKELKKYENRALFNLEVKDD